MKGDREDPILFDDYKAIRKGTGLSPQAWKDLQRTGEQRSLDKLYHRGELKVFSCLCRSPWCKKCAKSCQTSKTIRNRLLELDWKATRQVVLTVDRGKSPDDVFAHIRKKRAVSRLIKSMGLSECRWLWVLEFHLGGFPHWHLFIETSQGKNGMIGKRFIQKRWKHGLVWETYAQSEQHWQAICGYHRKAGYFAAESKAHQLVLPEYLMEEARVRKFSSNFKTPREMATPRAAKKDTVETSKAKRVQRVYKERLAECDTKAKIRKGKSWLEVPGSGAKIRVKAAKTLEMIDFKTFRGSNEDIIDLVSKLSPIV